VASKHNRKLHPIPLLLLLLVFAAALAGRWASGLLEPVAPGTGESVTVEIPSGSSTRDVSLLLATHHLIKDPTFFRYYARYRGLDAQIKGGEYQLSPAMTPDQILTKLSRGEVVIHRFTVPEGLTVAQVADLLAGKGLVNREKFLQLAAASTLNAAYLPKDVKLAQPLEGYLFPSTYDYKQGVTEAELLQMMYAGWENSFPPELQARAKELGMTVHEALTLASIIEKEAQVAEERPVISGVYMNRLHEGMKLDADPTVRYAVAKPQGQALTVADLEVDSPYNTYKRAGLPPGPIAAPGAASIKAALNPQKHDFWYFVAKEDGTGQHYFATTLAEQNANVAKAEQNAKK
jgi:UPF0755 protein